MVKQSVKDGRAFSVKRVLQHGAHFICGICHRRYEIKNQAQQCLERCSINYLRKDQILESQEENAKKFRCKYCRRVYASRQEAEACARDCHLKAKKQLKEAKSRPSPEPAQDKLSVLKSLAGTTAIEIAQKKIAQKTKQPSLSPLTCQKCGKSHQSKLSLYQCLRRHELESPILNRQRPPTQESMRQGVQSSYLNEIPSKGSNEIDLSRHESISAIRSGETVARPKDGHLNDPDDGISVEQRDLLERARKINAKKDTDKFARHHAKYVCRVCNEKYYTRVEVIQCFDKHLNPVENSNNPSPESKPNATQVDPSKIPENDKFDRDGAKYTCRGCGRGYYTKAEVVGCFDRACVEGKTDLEEEALTSEMIEKMNKNQLFRVDHEHDHKFYRNQANYTCRICKKNHMTREAVINCYDSHSDSNK